MFQIKAIQYGFCQIEKKKKSVRDNDSYQTQLYRKGKRSCQAHMEREASMSKMSDRERGFEAKYSFDLEQNFRVEAHLYKLLAQWAAREMGMDDAQCAQYADKIVTAVVTNPRDNGVAALVLADFARHNIDMTLSQLTARLEELRPQARADVL
jgi:hypothetical protein|tara:strand:+ start:20790 stop:21248 length:459 start_codon:yes stop_codon:yes gene_type:complete